ncbi:phosphoglycolate phosphatase [Variovorax sp. S2]|uniref:phosphoglycolate phosphatase n=1 Tax=Variovorax sp. S12S4 TaxID=3029170 RepID=UPI00215C89B6|nr:phosphoglycolate phosphatase [Variovorax sp. S12S4]MCR8958352.1 phosphoglycolate phosphatase [Variovorax sp. S12S4]
MTSLDLDLTRFDAAIVDLDGTMVDTLGDFAVSLNHMLTDLSLPPVPPAAVEKMVGKGSEHLILSALAHVMDSGGDGASEAGANALRARAEALFDRAWERYQHHYLAINGQHSAVYPGVPEGLKALRVRGLRLACLTNKPTSFAKPLLAAKGLDGFFEFAFGGDAFARKKPDPLPLLKTCEALGTDPARTLMVGDSSNDARAARAAGCPVVLVTYGYNHGEPVRGVDADGFVDSLAELGRAAV